MHPLINSWQSLPIPDIQSSLGNFTNGVSCGGWSIDWILGRTTREHGDTDIGVFRSDLINCLNSIDQRRVYLCDPPGELNAWDGEAVPERVHDIWITSAEYDHWTIQLMIYDDAEETVVYRLLPRFRDQSDILECFLTKLQQISSAVSLLQTEK